MGRYSGLLLCSDFDGTLAHEGKVSVANADAIRRFEEGGGRFTLATGRYPSILEEVKDIFSCNAPLISMNGAILYDATEDKLLYEGRMERPYLATLREITQQCDGILEYIFCPADTWRGEQVLPSDWARIEELFFRPLYKILVHVDEAKSDAIKKTVEELSGAGYAISRSWINGVEIQEDHYDKGKTARRLANLLGADQLICVGDYENDVPMLREADLAVAMGSAPDSVKAIAHRVTATAAEDGFALFLESL